MQVRIKAGGGGGGGIIATWDLNDTTVGTNRCPLLIIDESGTAAGLKMASKYATSVNLTIQIRQNFTVIATLTIPAGSAANTVFSTTTFTPSSPVFNINDLLTIDVTSSDGTASGTGVCTVELLYYAGPGGTTTTTSTTTTTTT